MDHQHRDVTWVDTGDSRGLAKVFWLNFGQFDTRFGA
jgi:hypothetical protein